MNDLSIIIVSWNTRDLLTYLLTSLCAESGELAVQIIVVDNASTDDSAAMVAERFPQVVLICNQDNIGYARANNQGIRQASGRYVLLLNSDVVLTSGALTGLVDFMDIHLGVGACSPRLLTADGAPQAYAFGSDPSLLYLLRRGLNRLIRNRPLHNWAVDAVQHVDWVSGACLLLRREALAQVQGLDEAFFMYFEDVDLCLRIRQQDWRICYVPDLEVTHLGGQSLQQNPAARQAYQQSLRYFYARHYGPFARGLLYVSLAAYNFWRDNLRRLT
jgi:N-acetylglucosaminyl-diphospho-decaprenol L-rhamnosyltransferase